MSAEHAQKCEYNALFNQTKSKSVYCLYKGLFLLFQFGWNLDFLRKKFYNINYCCQLITHNGAKTEAEAEAEVETERGCC